LAFILFATYFVLPTSALGMVAVGMRAARSED
jgi:hypothetical protein